VTGGGFPERASASGEVGNPLQAAQASGQAGFSFLAEVGGSGGEEIPLSGTGAKHGAGQVFAFLPAGA